MAVKTPITARQPFTALFVLASVFYLFIVRTPFLALYYSRADNRPDPQWRWKEAVGAATLKFFCAMITRARVGRVFLPNGSNPRRPTMPAASQDRLKGVVLSSSIKPVDVTGEWYPAPYEQTDVTDQVKVVLYFNGGAYVMGDYQACKYPYHDMSSING